MRFPVPARSLRTGSLIPELTAGLVMGALEVIFATSLAALIFSGSMSRHLPVGIGLSLLAAIVTMLVVSALTSLPGTVGSIQDVSAAVLGTAAAAIAVRLGTGERALDTVVLALGLTSAATGLCFLALGTRRLGNLVRFVPYPVIGGFLAGTGWLLVKGGAGVLTGTALTMDSVPKYFEGGLAARWVPGLALAVMLLVLGRRFKRSMVIPAALLAAVALSYVGIVSSGMSLAEARAQGWLLGPFPHAGLVTTWLGSAAAGADWGALASQAGTLATVVVVSVLALLLNASGIEMVLRRDMDLNAELRAAGAANLATGLIGGMPGFHTLSVTALGHRIGARTRLLGVVMAAVCAVALLGGTGLVELSPTVVLGGLVVFLGLGFLIEWLVDAWSRLPRAEYLLVVLILLVIAAWGFVVGVGVGLAVSLVLFAITYSRTEVVKHELAGSAFRSNVDREPSHAELLSERGDRIHVLELQGFVFFGTASALLDRIRDRMAAREREQLEFLVLDFRRVAGLDSSAVAGFVKAVQLAEAHGFTLVLTGMSERVGAQLAQAGIGRAEPAVPAGEGPATRVFASLDRGLQWCEDRLLDEAGVAGEEGTLEEVLRDGVGVEWGRIVPYLERVTADTGDVIVGQGDPSDDMFLLESGTLTVEMRRDGAAHRIRTLRPGVVVGEVAMYLRTPRAASVVSETPCVLYRLSRGSFEEMEARDPELASAVHRWMARTLAERLSFALRTMETLLD